MLTHTSSSLLHKLALDHADARGLEWTLPVRPITQTTFTGTSSNDVFNGTTGTDIFDMGQGGDDTVSGNAGDDGFFFDAAFTAADHIDGGGDSGGGGLFGRDEIYLNGDYSAGIVFTATTMVGVEKMNLVGGHSYKFTTHNATILAGDGLSIQGGLLGAGNNLTVDASAETDGYLSIVGGGGIDRLTGGTGDDQFLFFTGGFSAADRIDGGGGSNVINLTGDYSAGVVCTSTTFKNIDVVQLLAGNSYKLTLHNGNVAAGHSLNLEASGLGAGETVYFDGAQEHNGILFLAGGDGNDTLIGGRMGDFIDANGGADQITPRGGHDHLTYTAVTDSTSTSYDTVTAFNFLNADTFGLWFSVFGVETALIKGTLRTGHFDSDLETALDPFHLTPHYAIAFTPDGGNLAGRTFLVIDANGVPGYQTGEDLVIRLGNPTHVGAMDVGDFT